MELTRDAVYLGCTELWMLRDESGQGAVEGIDIGVLIERALTGDRAAFGEIVARHERRVLTLSWRFLGTMEDAQDAAQEVFLRAFKYLRRLDRTKPIEPWLVATTVNVCRVLGRKRQRHQTVFVASEVPDPPDSAQGPYAALSSEEQRRMLYRALEDLTERERTAVVLRELEGLSTAEVAAILGSSEATVRVQISTARLKLRKAILKLKGGAL